MVKYYTLLIGLLIPALSFGQTEVPGLINSGAYIVTTSGSNIYINGSTGNLTNTSGGYIKSSTGGTVTVNGNWINKASNGVFFNDGTTVVLPSSSAQSIGGTNGTSFYKLTASGGGTKTVNTASTISNLLTLGSSTIFNSNGKTTLLATASSNANVATIPSTSSVTGDMNVQVYFTGGSSAYRGTRGISAPINESLATTKTYAQLKNYMVITGPSGATNGFDPGGSAAPYAVSLTKYNEPATLSQSAFTNVASISESIAKGNGVFLFYRGDRTGYTSGTASTSNKVNQPFATPENTTMVWNGPINQGDVTVNLSFTANSGEDTYNGYNFIGNPYPATIDWTLVTRTNVKNVLRFIKAGGGYCTYDGTTTPATYVNGDASMLKIAPGQGFYTKATSTGASVVFTEACKAVSSSPARFLYNGFKDEVFASSGLDVPARTTTVSANVLRMSLDDGTNKDETVALFQDGESAAANGDDLVFLGGSTVALSTIASNNIKLTINRMPAITEATELKLSVAAASSGDLKLNFTDLSAVENSNIYLKDAYLNTLTDVKSEPTYNFSIDRNVSSTFGDNRFSIILTPPTVLPVNIASFKASKVAGGAQLSWSAKAEEGIVRYEIERSSDAVNYKKIKEVTKVGKTAYSVLDETPSLSLNYYRLKAIDANGKANEYLTALDYTLDAAASVAIFPNPATDYISVKLPEAKSIKLSIIDLSGKELKSKLVSDTMFVQENISELGAGTYIIQVINSIDNSVIVRSKFIVKK